MLAALHKVGIRVYVDIVPNHSSNLHDWFKEAIAAKPGSKARSRYIFRDGRGKKGELPPTDWVSHFAPSAWTHESAMGGKHNQWYMHWFAPEQPDFNWDNPEIQKDFLKTLKFWADRGVDAFRIDVAHALKKDLSEPLRNLDVFEGLEQRGAKGKGILADRDELFKIYKEWRKLFNTYDPPRVAVAEAFVHPERLPLYASTKTLGQCFDFRFIETPFEAGAYRNATQEAIELAEKNKSTCTWTLSNHDQIRHATKMGLNPAVNRRDWMLSDGTSHPLDKESGTNNGLAATLYILALPGSTYMFQGEELGLHEVTDIPEKDIQDPQYLRNHKIDKGRDGCRVPLPWTKSGSSFGFGTGSAHLPQPNWFGDYSVEVEEKDAHSPLAIYRRALELRKDLQTKEEIKWHKTSDVSVLHFSRPNGWNCITNFRAQEYTMPKGEILISSKPLVNGKIPAGTTVWFKKK
jgi:alpha-glucosidase